MLSTLGRTRTNILASLEGFIEPLLSARGGEVFGYIVMD